MKKIGLILIGLMIIYNVGVAWAEPTVKDILNKVAQTSQKQKDNIQDLSCKQTVIYESPAGNQLSTISDLYLKKNGKVKNIVYNDDGSVLQIQIRNNAEYKFIDYKGEVFQAHYWDSMTQEEKDQLQTALADISLPGALDYDQNPTQFLLDYKVTIDIALSDIANNIYVLKVENQVDPNTQAEKANNIFKKMEIKVDYNKGVILGEKMYNPSGYLLTDDTYTGYEKIGTELSDFWYSKMLIEKTAVEQDQFLTKTVKYEKILFNQDLSDEIFQ